MSGITFFINQQARYRNFDNVFAAIGMIGIIGLTSDMFLAWLGTILFPWKRRGRARKSKVIAISMVASQNRGEPNPTADSDSPPAAVSGKVAEVEEMAPALPAGTITKPTTL
jgi:NitT/TauT family transport system permease protein